MIIHLLTRCVINKPVFSFETVNHVRPLLFMTLWCWFWLHSLRNALKYVRYSCQKCLQAADEINFPRYQEAVPPHVLHKSLRTAGAASLLQPPATTPLSRHSRGYLLFHMCERDWHFPIGSRSTSRGALCPLHLPWFAQLKWDKAHGGLWIFTGEPDAEFFFFFWQLCWGFVELRSPPEAGGLPHYIHSHRK